MCTIKPAAGTAWRWALLFLAGLFIAAPGVAQTTADAPVQSGVVRSLDDLFPGLGEDVKTQVLGRDGYIRSLDKNESLALIPAPASGIDLVSAVMKTNPSYLAEALMVVPYAERKLTRLDAYNVLGRISDLKGRLYHSQTRNAEIPLFEDATRLESAKKTNPVPDPQPAAELPPSDTVYIRLKDVNFGNSYYRGDMSAGTYGITYKLTNFKNLTYLFFTVMKEGKFSAILYMEPLAEGMLVYSVAGADTSDFIANRIDIPSAISKRLAVFTGWIGDGLLATR